MKTKILLLLLPVTLLFSCASIYMNKSSDAAVEIIESLNEGNSELPSENSSVPFIFDGEIIVSNASVSRIWGGLVNAGFTVMNPTVTSLSPVVTEDFALFRSSWELEVFFKRNIPRYTYKVTIEGIEGEVLLLVNRDEEKNYIFLGLKADAK